MTQLKCNKQSAPTCQTLRAVDGNNDLVSTHTASMISRPGITWLAFFLLMLSCDAFAEDSPVAIVDLRFIEDTGEVAAVLCFDDDQCGTWATYYLFEAKVRKEIFGSLPETEFLVLFGRHALKQGNLKKVIARFELLEEPRSDGARYRISDRGEKQTMYCFEGDRPPQGQHSVLLDGQHDLDCYDRR